VDVVRRAANHDRNPAQFADDAAKIRVHLGAEFIGDHGDAFAGGKDNVRKQIGEGVRHVCLVDSGPGMPGCSYARFAGYAGRLIVSHGLRRGLPSFARFAGYLIQKSKIGTVGYRITPASRAISCRVEQ
jgi:hypothetical protein